MLDSARDVFGSTSVECIVDDILVWGENDEQHDCRVRQMLQRCRQMNFKLNKSKFELRAPEVQYVGHVISKDGLKVSPEKVRAIQEMPASTEVACVKRVLGLVQYLAKFIPNLSDISDPLRILVKKDVQWHWNREQQQSFHELKRIVSRAPVLRFYSVDEPLLFRSMPVLNDWAWSYCKADSLSRTVPKRLVRLKRDTRKSSARC